MLNALISFQAGGAMGESDVIALVAAIAAIGSAAIAWLALRASSYKVKISAFIFHDEESQPHVKMMVVNSSPREVEIQFSNVLLKAPSSAGQIFGVEEPWNWRTAHINWTGPTLPHRLRGDAPVTWWGDGYMVEYNLGRPVGPDFVGKIDVNLGGRTRFIDLVYKDWSNTYFPPFDRLEIPEDAE
jgi:hypothetical protein